jgi:hypothetical protein
MKIREEDRAGRGGGLIGLVHSFHFRSVGRVVEGVGVKHLEA